MKTIVAVIFLVFAILIGMQELEKDRALFYTSLSQEYLLSDSELQQSDTSSIYVIVTLSGNVLSPGEYEVAYNTYLEDVIIAAGGLLENTDSKSYDPYFVIDGENSFYIPKTSDKDKVSLNEGDVDDFISLPSIGTTIATRIIDYREENGSFLQIEGIMNVSGIGKTIFDNIKDQITL